MIALWWTWWDKTMRMLLLAGVQPDSGIEVCRCSCGRVHVADKV